LILAWGSRIVRVLGTFQQWTRLRRGRGRTREGERGGARSGFVVAIVVLVVSGSRPPCAFGAGPDYGSVALPTGSGRARDDGAVVLRPDPPPTTAPPPTTRRLLRTTSAGAWGLPVSAGGESLDNDIQPTIAALVPGVAVDGAVSRQWEHGREILSASGPRTKLVPRDRGARAKRGGTPGKVRHHDAGGSGRRQAVRLHHRCACRGRVAGPTKRHAAGRRGPVPGHDQVLADWYTLRPTTCRGSHRRRPLSRPEHQAMARSSPASLKVTRDGRTQQFIGLQPDRRRQTGGSSVVPAA